MWGHIIYICCKDHKKELPIIQKYKKNKKTEN
jgi:hypothetical protein